jgi:hypothetical protein
MLPEISQLCEISGQQRTVLACSISAQDGARQRTPLRKGHPNPRDHVSVIAAVLVSDWNTMLSGLPVKITYSYRLNYLTVSVDVLQFVSSNGMMPPFIARSRLIPRFVSKPLFAHGRKPSASEMPGSTADGSVPDLKPKRTRPPKVVSPFDEKHQNSKVPSPMVC